VSFLDVHYAQDANGEPAMFVVLHKTRLLVLTEFFMEVHNCIALTRAVLFAVLHRAWQAKMLQRRDCVAVCAGRRAGNS
jgi:hypothetical protein